MTQIDESLNVLPSKKRYILTLFLFFSFLYPTKAQSDYAYLLNLSYTDRVQILDTLVLKELRKKGQKEYESEVRKIEELAIRKKDKELALDAKIALLQWLPSNDVEQHIIRFEELIQQAQKDDLKYHLITIRFLYSRYLYTLSPEQGYQIKFLELVYMNEKLLLSTSLRILPQKKAILIRTGEMLYNYENYAAAKKYLLIADTLSIDWRSYISVSGKNTLGLIYRKEKMYDSALFYFNEAYEVAFQNDLSIWKAITKGNIGIVYYKKKEYAKAMPLLEYDIAGSLKGNEYGNAIASFTWLIDIYLERGEYDKAKKCIDSVMQYRDYPMQFKSKKLMDFSKVVAKYYRLTNRPVLSLQYRDSVDIYYKAFLEGYNTKLPLQIHRQINEAVHREEEKRLIVEKERLARLRNMLVIGILLTCIFAYLIISKLRQSHRTKQLLSKSKAELAEKELDNAKEQLLVYTSKLKEKNKLLEHYSSKIGLISRKENDIEDYSFDNHIQELLQATILTEDEWQKFKSIFDKVYTGYIDRLFYTYPDLSQSDIRFLVLSKLNLSNKEMAAILGVRPDTLRTNKYRLRKKLGITTEDEFTQLIEHI